MPNPTETLRNVLAYHGFHEAALKLEVPPWQAEAVLPAWTHYPMCLDGYVKRISRQRCKLPPAGPGHTEHG